MSKTFHFGKRSSMPSKVARFQERDALRDELAQQRLVALSPMRQYPLDDEPRDHDPAEQFSRFLRQFRR